MRALRDSETASQSIGLDPVLIRTTAFALSAAAAGLAGGMFASISNFISPESFPFFQSILFLLVVMIGGAERVMGPVAGAVIVVLLPEALSFLAQYRLLFVGLLLLAVLLLAPGGFVGLIARFLPSRPQSGARRRSATSRRISRAASADKPFGQRSFGQFRRRARGGRALVRGEARRDHQHHRPERRRARAPCSISSAASTRPTAARCGSAHATSPACRRTASRRPASRAPTRPPSCSPTCR